LTLQINLGIIPVLGMHCIDKIAL